MIPIEEWVRHQLTSLFGALAHVGDVSMADVGAVDRFQLRIERGAHRPPGQGIEGGRHLSHPK